MDLSRRLELLRTERPRAPPDVIRPLAVRQNRWRNSIRRSDRKSAFRRRQSRLRSVLLERRLVRLRHRTTGLAWGRNQHRGPRFHGRKYRPRSHPRIGRLSAASLRQRTLPCRKQRRRHRGHDEHRPRCRNGWESRTSSSWHCRLGMVPWQRSLRCHRVLRGQGQMLRCPEPSGRSSALESASSGRLPTTLPGRNLEMLSRIQTVPVYQE